MQPTPPADPAEALRNNLRTPVADDQRRDHVRVVNGQQPYRHHYFTPRDFYRHDPRSGTITNVYGQRVVRATQEWMPALAAALDAEVGDAAGDILFRCGLSWGRTDIDAFVPRVEQEYEIAFEKLSMGTMLTTWWWPFRVAGWGCWQHDFRFARMGIIGADLFDSAVVGSMGQVGRPVCHFYAGLFAAVFGKLAKRDLGGCELQCAAQGASHCRFVVSTTPRIHQAAGWVKDGVSADDIMARLTNPQ